VIIPPDVFSAVIVVALTLVVGAPFILLGLLIRDWRRKRLW
jgi:hypothetical protein